MKQVAVLVISIFLMSTLSAQVDTVPPVKKQPQLDTVPPVKRNTIDTAMKKWPDDSIANRNWSNDSALSKEMPARPDRNMPGKDEPGKTNKATNSAVTKIEKPMSDRVMMKDGEMIVVKNGESIKMSKALTLPTGLVVSPDGTVSRKGAAPLKLKEGQYIEIKPVPAEKVMEKKPTVKKVTTKKVPIKKIQ